MSDIVNRLQEWMKYSDISASRLSELLEYKSGEKIYRLFRNKKAKPSVDILIDLSNKFVSLNIKWLLTGEGRMLNQDTPSQDIETTNNKKDYSPLDINTEIKLRSCLEVADSKEKIIKLLEENAALKDEKIKYLQSDIRQLKEKLNDCLTNTSK